MKKIIILLLICAFAGNTSFAMNESKTTIEITQHRHKHKPRPHKRPPHPPKPNHHHRHHPPPHRP
ncbi:MAG: hypothetical protein ABI402_08565 [Ferruginibacter sp.]